MPRKVLILLTLVSSVGWCAGPLRPPGAAGAAPSSGPASGPATRPAHGNAGLPGVVIDFQQRHVDVESTVCLRQGLLELIACTKDTKEHESIVVVHARPMHIHLALLLLGAKNGNPAMRRPTNEDGTQWIDVPPSGDPVDVYLVLKSKDGKLVERPISDFVAPARKETDKEVGAKSDNAAGAPKFPRTFLFAGSGLRQQGPGPRRYLSELSGDVISVVTFGDELLCLPDIQSQDDASLVWQVDATDLPAIGTKVTLRLRPIRPPAAKTDGADRPSSIPKPSSGPATGRE
jgi:hypothetical protein